MNQKSRAATSRRRCFLGSRAENQSLTRLAWKKSKAEQKQVVCVRNTSEQHTSSRKEIKTRTKERQEPSTILLGFEEQTMGERIESTDSSRNKELKQAAKH
jgi:LAS superfamily LD-carboxypeptidase LdcB